MQILQNKVIRKFVTLLTAITLLNISIAPVAMANVVSTDDILFSSQIAEKRSDIQNFVAREDVRDKLLGYGVSEADLDSRIANLTDAEVLQMHEQMENMPAGQGILGTVIGILVIFMLLDIAGVTDIFPGV